MEREKHTKRTISSMKRGQRKINIKSQENPFKQNIKNKQN